MRTTERKATDYRQIHEAARRACKLAARNGIVYEFLDAAMDLEAADQDCPLDFKKLLSFGDGDFGHDVFGIRRFLDRDTKSLAHCFIPRCALPAGA
jgi:hypothetical protein